MKCQVLSYSVKKLNFAWKDNKMQDFQIHLRCFQQIEKFLASAECRKLSNKRNAYLKNRKS